MKDKHEKQIKGIVEGLLKDWEQKKTFRTDVLEKGWKQAVGKKASKHARAVSFKGGRLVVEVDDSSWMYQLTLKKQEMLDKINKFLKDIKISDIQFRIGNFN